MTVKESNIEEKEFDLKQFLLKYLRYWYLFVIALFIALGVAWFANWYAAPVYYISGKLLIKDEASTPERAILKDLDIASQGKNLENEIEILRSHRLVGKALENLEFDVSYFLIGNIKTTEVYLDSPVRVVVDSAHHYAYFTPFQLTVLDAATYEWAYETDGGKREVFTGKFNETLDFPFGRIQVLKRDNFSDSDFQDPNFEKRKFKILIHGSERLRNYYVNRLNIAPISGQSTIVEVSLLEELPQKGIDFLNALISVYLQNDVNQKNLTADNTSVFIDQQLEKISLDLKTIESARESYKARRGIIDLSSESQVVLELARSIDEKIAANNARKSIISNLKEYVSNEENISELAPSTIDINDVLLNNLIERLHFLETEKQKVGVGSTSKNPQFTPLLAEINLTRLMIVENITNIEKTLDLANRELEQELIKVRQRIEKIPTTERELIGIERQYRIQESLYLYLLEKQAEVSISLASSVSDNRIVDTARASAGPVKPVKSKAYSIALIIGLLVPVIFIYLREQFDDSVHDVQTISGLTGGIPVLGMVGLSKNNSKLVITEKPNSLIAEAYRSIRTNLKFFGIENEKKVLLITSSIGTEGKTFTAMNLSSVLALSGKRTVLLGLDLRKPKIIDDFQLANDKGISTYLSNEHSLDEVLQPSKLIDGFDIIPSGPVPPNPSELIMSQRMDDLIRQLYERYDYIIIDSPPVGLVTDGFILMKHADLSIFVVRQGTTKKHHLRHIRQMNEQQKLGPVTILFNAIKANRGAGGYGYGYHYGYGYGYGNGHGYYNDAEVKRGVMSRVKSVFSKS